MSRAYALDGEAQAELERIRLADPDKILRPEAVVEAASDPDSPLHDRFTWNDDEAAHLFRLQQARYLIRVSVKVLPSNPEPVRCYVSISTDRPDHRRRTGAPLTGGSTRSGGYRAIEDVLRNTTLEQQMLADALAELRRFERKYSRLSELADLFRSIRDILSEHEESDDG